RRADAPAIAAVIGLSTTRSNPTPEALELAFSILIAGRSRVADQSDGRHRASNRWPPLPQPFGNQCWVRLAKATSDSITGTSTRTPTTVASAAPECRPNRLIATATANSKKLDVPMSAQGAATLNG